MKNKMHQTIAEGKNIYIGLEDSKKSWKLCVRSEHMVIHETSMPAQYAVLKAYLRNRYPKCRISVVYEAGFKGFTLRDNLVKDGYGCIVTPSHTVTQPKIARVKCDKIDARRLAKNLENNDCKECHVLDKQQREDRQISRTLIQVQKDIVRCKNRMRKFLDFHGFDEILPAGKWSDADYRALEEVVRDLPEPLAFSFRFYKEQLQYLLATKERYKAKLKTFYDNSRYSRAAAILESSPGIGWFSAIRLVLEWGSDLSRFESPQHLAAFTGLTGIEASTGETEHRGPITKLGNRFVRALIIECTWVAYKRDPVLLKKYQAVYSRTSNKNKAIVAVARKLVGRLYTISLKGTTYTLNRAA